MNSNFLSVVIPNRNRDLHTVKRTLDSLQPQLDERVIAIIVDYGSEQNYQTNLDTLISSYDKMELVLFSTQGQLWNKSRCINFVLKHYHSEFLMVSDMDMIWHPKFIEQRLQYLTSEKAQYFQVGFLSQNETQRDKKFHELQTDFYSNKEATGISIFPSKMLWEINGFDEFYHGWGSEDSDVHERLRHAGFQVEFHEETCFFKHQWHPKKYRNKESKEPFHPNLERINQSYFSLSRKRKIIKTNNSQSWGTCTNEAEYESLKTPNVHLKCFSLKEEVLAALIQISSMDDDEVVSLVIKRWRESKYKQILKIAFGKNVLEKYNMNQVNELILEWIIMNFRDSAYIYSFADGHEIELKIRLKHSPINVISA